MEASTGLMFALIGVVIGIVIGAVGYHIASNRRHGTLELQQKYLESERQVSELKSRMGSHLLEVQQRIETIREEAYQLEQQLDQETQHWHLDNDALRHLDLSDLRTTELHDKELHGKELHEHEQEASRANAPVPRDYADGQNGTLSEDFGLKEADTPPQPPRY